jgi:long-chain acyl-CoA synthetase
MVTKKTKTSSESPYAAKPWLKHYDYFVPTEVSFPQQSIYQSLNQSATQFGDRPATAFLGAQMSFGELKSHADKLAAALSKLGIGKGDRVGIMLPNCPQYIISFFAVVRLGAIVANVNPIYTAREVELVAADSGMRVMIVLDALATVVQSIIENTKIEKVITTNVLSYSANPQAAQPAPKETLSFTDLIAEVEEVKLPSVIIDAKEDVAALVYTGGTTGVPKGAMLTHYNLFAAAIQCAVWSREFFPRGEGSFLVVIPYFHVYGLVVGCIFGVWQGAMQIPIAKFDANLLIDAFRNYKPTYFPGVPTLFISLLNNPDAVNAGLNSVQRFNSGSAPLPVEVIEQFEAMSGAALLEGYGMTETAAICTSTSALGKRKPGSIGLPMPSTECRIVDLETGKKEVLQGETGELCVRGPQVMKGYWNNPEETAMTLRDGWLYTGDIARMDEDGYFYIVQRKKDMIIVSGFNVYPNEIEDELFTHPAVKECAVIGVADEYRGEAVKAFVVLKQDAQATVEELMEFCREKMAKYKVPSFIEFRDSLPKSAVGKVLRRELREEEENKLKH